MVNPCSHVAAAIHIPEATYFNSKEVVAFKNLETKHNNNFIFS